MTVMYGARSAPIYGPTYAAAQDSGAATPPGTLAADVSFAPSSALPGGLALVYGVNGTSWCPVGQSPSAPTLSECAWFALQGAASGWLNVTEVRRMPRRLGLRLLTVPRCPSAGDDPECDGSASLCAAACCRYY